MSEVTLAVKQPVLDFLSAEKQIAIINQGVGDLAIRLSALKITNQDEYDRGVLMIKESNMVIKRFETKKDELNAAPKKFIDSNNSSIKAICAPIEAGVKYVKEQGKSWLQSEADRKSKEEDKLRQQKLKAEQAVADSNTAKEQTKAVSKVVAIETKIENVQKSSIGYVARRRKFEILDASLIPREYLVVDETKIRSVMGKTGEPFITIPGVRFFDDQDMRG